MTRRRYLYIVFFIISLLVLLEVGGRLLHSRVASEWDSIKERQAAREAALIINKFERVQTRIHRIAERVSHLIAPLPYECHSNQECVHDYFETLAQVDLDELQGIEIYDHRGNVIAWWGRVTDEPGDEILVRDKNEAYSRIVQGTVFTTLTVVIPMPHEREPIRRYVAVHEAFDVQYMLSPRFIRMQGLRRDLRELIGRPVHLVFDEISKSPGELYVPLRGIDHSFLGFAVIPPPTREAYLSNVDETIIKAQSFLVIVLSMLIIYYLIQWLRRTNFPFLNVLIVLTIAWVVRYAWMALRTPGNLIGGAVFDPAYYASPHGGGVVASPGDLFITAIFLIFSSLILFHSIVINNSLKIPSRIESRNRMFTLAASFFVMLLFMGLIRSYAASVRSLVFDSSVRFADPSSLVPSPMLAMMQLNLLAVTASFVIFGTVLGYIALRLVQANLPQSFFQSTLILSAIVLSAATVYYVSQNNPLVGLWYYISVPLILITITVLVQRGFLQSFRLYKIRSILFLTGVSVLFATPVLAKKIHNFDREHIQFIARNIVRPADAWKEFILQQSLQEFRTDQTLIRLLETEDRVVLERQAFHLWARSMLGREGYNTTIFIQDTHGNLVSRFSIGFQILEEVPYTLNLEAEHGEQMLVEDVETLYGKATLYSAISDIRNAQGEKVGTITVKLIAGPGTLFRGYSPDILRTQISPDIAARYGQLIISEFRGRKLVSTSATDIPATHTIPVSVIEKLQDSEDSFVWVREHIEGKTYETVYFRDMDDSGESYLAISMRGLDLRWYGFYALKLILFALTASGLIILSAGVVFYAQGKRYQPTFKEKILIGLLSISLIPIVIVAYFNREFTLEQMTENISRQLYDEAKRVSLQIERYIGEDENRQPSSISQAFVERIAAELGIDFIIYVDGYMHSTSRMEMFEAELMDRRLSGFAYSNIVLKRKNFITREEAIGQSSYLVGYYPLLDREHQLSGVIAVPAIYRQAEIDEELARRDAFLFGVYALVMLGIVVTGLIVAHRVSRPIEKLTEATHKVAGGQLDIHLESKGESEIAKLMQSFNTMAQRLQESREELARVERELAWREMAKQVAHEIKNPLTPMKLSIQQLRQEYKDHATGLDDSFEKVTRMLLEQIETLDRIASEFSRFARMPIPHYESVDVNEILRRAIAVFPQGDGVDFQTNFDDTIPVINADPEELQRAFINVIRNSIQAMPEGGTVDIATQLDNGYIRIRISDSGTGIPPEVRGRLFEPNFSTKTEGMGLGLALVKKTITELNGTIDISSVENVGTTVIIKLPITDEHRNNNRKELP